MENPQLYVHNTGSGLNSYLLVNDEQQALLVDLFTFDRNLFFYIKKLNISIKAVLLTHLTPTHTGLTVFKRIYSDTPIYGPSSCPHNNIIMPSQSDIEALQQQFNVTLCLNTPYNNTGLMAIKTPNYLFTGPLLTNGSYPLSFPYNAKQHFLKQLPISNEYLLGSYGPPTTWSIELEGS